MYPDEVLDEEIDNGTMPESKEALAQAVIGHRIVKTERRDVVYDEYGYTSTYNVFVITLDNGKEVRLREVGDCCAGTDITEFLLHPDKVDHIILGVGTTEEYTRWHIFADWGDVLELTVGWSCGNPFYYGYGFDIDVVDVDAT